MEMIMMTLIQQLNQMADQFGLEKQALEGVSKVLASDESGLDEQMIKQLVIGFKSHKLCFRHGEVDAQFIETTLSINFDGDDVGYYALFTDMDGQSFDDALNINLDEE